MPAKKSSAKNVNNEVKDKDNEVSISEGTARIVPNTTSSVPSHLAPEKFETTNTPQVYVDHCKKTWFSLYNGLVLEGEKRKNSSTSKSEPGSKEDSDGPAVTGPGQVHLQSNFGVKSLGEIWWGFIERRHGEAHRKYHSLTHIYKLLKKLDEESILLEKKFSNNELQEAYPDIFGNQTTYRIPTDYKFDKSSIQLAIFFHDLVYNPEAASGKNEDDSAEFFLKFVKELRPYFEVPNGYRIAGWIRATKNHKWKESMVTEIEMPVSVDNIKSGKKESSSSESSTVTSKKGKKSDSESKSSTNNSDTTVIKKFTLVDLNGLLMLDLDLHILATTSFDEYTGYTAGVEFEYAGKNSPRALSKQMFCVGRLGFLEGMVGSNSSNSVKAIKSETPGTKELSAIDKMKNSGKSSSKKDSSGSKSVDTSDLPSLSLFSPLHEEWNARAAKNMKWELNHLRSYVKKDISYIHLKLVHLTFYTKSKVYSLLPSQLTKRLPPFVFSSPSMLFGTLLNTILVMLLAYLAVTKYYQYFLKPSFHSAMEVWDRERAPGGRLAKLTKRQAENVELEGLDAEEL